MATGNIKIKVDIESIVKLICLNRECRFCISANLTCNLKQVVLDKEGKCKQFEQRKPIESIELASKRTGLPEELLKESETYRES